MYIAKTEIFEKYAIFEGIITRISTKIILKRELSNFCSLGIKNHQKANQDLCWWVRHCNFTPVPSYFRLFDENGRPENLKKMSKITKNENLDMSVLWVCNLKYVL